MLTIVEMNNISGVYWNPITSNQDEGTQGTIFGPASFRFVSGDGHYILTESFLIRWSPRDHLPLSRSGKPLCSESEAESIRGLIKSLVWREGLKSDGGRDVVVTTSDSYEKLLDRIQDKGHSQYYYVRTIEDLLAEVESYGFESRCLETLENILAYLKQNEQVFCSYYEAGSGYWKTKFHEVQATAEQGMTFATGFRECHFVYQWLEAQGYISLDGSGVKVTAAGYAKLDEKARNSNKSSRSVFVIRRWDQELDKFLRPVFDEVGSRLNLNIQAVWEEEHNDRIDERILRKIRECGAVILHVTNNRFNVGLEAGYALALGKPIVTIRERPKPDSEEWEKALPFDILTLNCYDYDSASPDILVDKLEARLAMAFGL